MLKLNLIVIALVAIAFLLSTACSPKAKHPNQLNDFDGASYDSLTAAHAALYSLRDTVSTSYPQYKAAFNQAAASYQLALNAYTAFRTTPADQMQAAMAIENLTVSVVNLESSFQRAMKVEPLKANSIRQHTYSMRAAHANLNISTILTELQIAATIAATVPGTQPYAAIAQVVISATRSAIDATMANSGQLIDLSTLTPVPPIA